MPYARVLLVSAFLIPSVLSGQTPATAPPDALFHAVTYVETRAPAAKAARATLEQDRAASRKQDGLMRVESFEQNRPTRSFRHHRDVARSEDVRRAQCRAAEKHLRERGHAPARSVTGLDRLRDVLRLRASRPRQVPDVSAYAHEQKVTK